MGDQGVFLPGAVVLQVRRTARQYVALGTLGEALASVRSIDPLTGVARAEVQLVAAVCLIRGGVLTPSAATAVAFRAQRQRTAALVKVLGEGRKPSNAGGPRFGPSVHFQASNLQPEAGGHPVGPQVFFLWPGCSTPQQAGQLMHCQPGRSPWDS